MPDYTDQRITMVDTQIRPSDVTKFPIIDAMLTIRREEFVPAKLGEVAYAEDAMDLDDVRQMLEPRTFAKMIDALDIGPDDVILDIGCGLGYSTAILAHMASFVVGVEDDAQRASDAQNNLSEQSVDNAAVVEGALIEGAAKSGPYDIMVIEGAVETVPAGLIDQLREGGRIAAIFRDGALGVVKIGHKIDGDLTWRFAFNACASMLPGFEKAQEFTF